MNRRLALTLVVLGICGCVNRVNVLKPTGEKVSLALAEGVTHHGELWSVSDSLLVFESAGQVLTAHPAEVTQVRVEGYSLRKQRLGAVIAPLVGYSVGAVAATVRSLNTKEWWSAGLALFSGAMVPLTVRSFLTGDPKTDFRGPLEPKDIAALRLYCRYPQGLTAEQLAELRELIH